MSIRATGDAPPKFDLLTIRNIDATLARQVHNLNQTRQSVRGLQFVPVDPVGTYFAAFYKGQTVSLQNKKSTER